MSTPGRLKPPYPVEHCANRSCVNDGSLDSGAFLFKNLDHGRLTIFCDDCARHVELNARTQYALVPL